MKPSTLANHKPAVAIVVPGLSDGGGVPAVGVFLHDAVRRSGRYRADLISIAVSSGDKTSVRLASPLSWWRGPQESVGSWQGIPFKHVGSYLAEVEVARYLPRAQLTFLLEGYDIIQVVAGSPMFAFAVASLRKPKCLSVATTILQDRRSALDRARGPRKIWQAGMTGINMLLERFVLPRMDHVFAQSEYTRKQLEGLVVRSRLSIGPPGVDTALFRPGTYRAEGYILSVARFSDPRKNVRSLFKAYHLLKQGSANTPRLLLAGSAGPTEEDWKLARDLGIVGRITFEENPSSARLAELYREAAIFVLPSNEEGFGVVVVEAMASGIPVVSTRCGGPDTIVDEGRTGHLTPVGDVGAMAVQLRELLEHPLKRRQMGEAARRVAEERFSLRAAGRAYTDVYDSLLS